MTGRALTQTRARRPIRHTIEIRNASFQCQSFVELLRRNDIALVVADTAGRWPLFEDVTSDFVYVRLHGDIELYRSGYSPAALEHWARRVRAWRKGGEVPDAIRACSKPALRRKGRDVYVYFDNDAKVHAPFDAIALSRRLGLTELELRHPAPAHA